MFWNNRPNCLGRYTWGAIDYNQDSFAVDNEVTFLASSILGVSQVMFNSVNGGIPIKGPPSVIQIPDCLLDIRVSLLLCENKVICHGYCLRLLWMVSFHGKY